MKKELVTYYVCEVCNRKFDNEDIAINHENQHIKVDDLSIYSVNDDDITKRYGEIVVYNKKTKKYIVCDIKGEREIKNEFKSIKETNTKKY